MKRTLASIALLALLSMAALAQTGSATPKPAASTPSSAAATSTGIKVGVIDMQGAIAGSNEGQRDLEALAKKFEPRRQELQNLQTEIENLKKQLTNQGDKLSDDARASLVKSIETKQKTLQRSGEDAQNEFQQQQNEIAGRILQKMVPVINKYVSDNGFGLLIDASVPWPQGPVVIATAAVDVTRPIVDAYNVQSGVPAPAARTGAATTTPAAKPATTAPAATKPAAGTATKPQ